MRLASITAGRSGMNSGNSANKKLARRIARGMAVFAALALSTAAARAQIVLNNSSFDITPVADTSANGLSGRQFLTPGTTFNDTQRIDFTQLANLIRVDGNIDFPDNTQLPPTNAVQWIGKLNLTAGGDYQFGTASDDGSRLFIDGVMVVQNDGPKGVMLGTSNFITLSAGMHDIRLDYINGSTGAGESLKYNGPDSGGSLQTIGTSALYTAQTNTLAGASNAVIVGSGIGDALSVTGNSTFNMNGSAFTQAQVGNATFATGSALNLTTSAGINGKALRIGGTASFGSAVTLNLVGDGTNGSNMYFDGALSDGGVATTITKTGSGRLYFDNTTSANNLGSGSLIDVQAGTVQLVGSSATGAFNPIGSAGIRLSGGNLVLDSKVGNLTLGNAITVTQDSSIQTITNTSVTTLTSAVAVPTGKTLTLDAIAGGNPLTSAGATLLMSGGVSGTGNLNIRSTNVGTLYAGANDTFPVFTPFKGNVAFGANTAGFTGAVTVNGGSLQLITPQTLSTASSITVNNGELNLTFDGDGTGQRETIAYNYVPVFTGTSAIVGVGRSNTAVNFPLAANKIIQVPWTTNGIPLTVQNTAGYGLEVLGATNMTADQTYSVLNATASDLNAGLIQTGKVSGAFNVIKQGAGVLVLNNATNDFGGNSNFIDIQGGVVAVATDSALGNASNGIRLNANGTANVGLRATDSFTTARTISFGQTSNGIEVTGGKTLRITSPFDVPSGSMGLVKNDSGVLELAADNSTGNWSGSYNLGGTLSGGLRVNQGIVRVLNSGALGQSGNPVVVFTNTNAGIELAGGVNVPNPLTLNHLTTNAYAAGINWGGALRSVSGNNEWSGPINENQDSGISADAGSTLTVSGGITYNAHIVVFGGAGNVNVVNNSMTLVHSLDKIGSGTTNIQVHTDSPTGNGIRIFAGNLTFSGNGEVSPGASNGNVQTIIEPGGTLNLDNGVTQQSNRMGTRPMQFLGGNLNFIGGTAAGSSLSTELIGTPTFNRGQTTITLTPGAGGVTLNFNAASNSAAPAQSSTPSGATALFRGLGTSATGGVGTMAWTAGGLTFNGQQGATATTSKGLVPWALVDTSSTGLGTSFATADSAAAGANSGTNPIRALATSEYATGNLSANNNMLVTTGLTNQATVAPNSLTIDTGGSIAMAANASLSLSSGGVLVRNGVTTTIGGAGIVSLPAGNSPWSVHTVGTAALTINAVMSGGSQADRIGLVKAGGGTMTLTTPTSTITGLSGLSANTLNLQTVVNQGKLVLNGGKNTLGANNYLEIGAGGTLDLNGTSQYVLGLFTDGVYNGIPNAVTSGGTLTNSGAAQSTFVTNSDARNFSGQITGNMFFNRTGTITATTLYVPQTYTGGTLINGGTLSLRDYASLVNTPTIDINYAALTADNSQAAGIADRIKDTAQINLRGGTLTLQGRVQTDSTETVGAISVIEGVTVVDSIAGGTGVNSAVLTAASLTRPAGSAGVVILGRGSSPIDQNGQLGSQPRMLVTAAPALTNNIIGPWAIIRRDWASNIPTLGIGQLNATGFAGYSLNTLNGSPLATDNIKITTPGSVTTLTQDTTVNTLNLTTTDTTRTANGDTVIDLGGKRLTLQGGGVIWGVDGNFQTHILRNGTVTSGYANGAVNDLYMYQGAFGGNDRYVNIGAAVVNNGATPVRLIVNAGDGPGNANRTILTGANTYTGGTVVNQGTLQVAAGGVIPAGGITLNGGALTQTVGGVINPANVITLNGPSQVAFADNNTIAGLVFNNNGGGSNAHQVQTYTGGVGTSTGTLTIGASGIMATSSNVAATSTVAGRVDFGTTANNVTVDPIMVNGVDVNPLQAGLALQGIVGSSGGINKLGAGTLQLNGQSINTGPLNINAGGVSFGRLGDTGLAAGNAAGSRFSSTVMAAGTRLNLNNTDATIGSLAGSGVVINVAATGAVATTGLATGRTFNVGFDNTNTTFSGQFLRYNDALPNPYQVQKIGTGTWTLNGTGSNMTGNLQVSQGTVVYSGAGLGSFGTYIPVPNGTLTLDNSGTNVNNRMANGLTTGGTLSVGGGTFRMIGNSGVATSETIGTLNMSPGSNLYGNSTITLEANAAKPLTLTATAFGGINVGTSGLIRGISPTAGNGLANLALGTATLNAPAGSGSGPNGTTTMAIRPDILGDASITGLGTGFITKDSVTNFLRPLAASELAGTAYSGANSATVNYGLSSGTNLAARTVVGSLTLNTGGSFGTDPGVAAAGRDGLPVGLVVNTGGILNFGANTTINVARLETQNNLAYHFRTKGDLTVNSVLFGTNNGLNKGDAGTLTLGGRNLYTGQTQINLGKLVLNGGDNTLPLLVTGGAPGTTAIGVNAPGSTIDFNGINQITGTIGNNQNDRFAGSGGIVTNSSATQTNWTSISGSNQGFGGQITGNLNFTKTGNNPLALTNVNTYTGTTTVRANTLQLIDQGTLSNTSAVNLYYGGLNIDQTGLTTLANLNPTHLPAATPVNLRGGTLQFTPAGSIDSSATINNVKLEQSHNTISVPNIISGGYGVLNIGNIAHAANPDATVNFVGGNGGFFAQAPGINNTSVFINTIDGVAIPAVIPNKILGGWAIANNGEFATYISPSTPGANGSNWGVVTMNGNTGVFGQFGTITQDLYDSNAATFPVSNENSNVRISGTGTITLPSGGANYNVVAIRAAATAINFVSSSDVLNLTAGGLALTNGGTTLGAAANPGVLTAGGSPSTPDTTVPLYVYSNGASNRINSTIVDNTSGSGNKVRLVITPIANTLNLGGSNTYTGGTVINGGGGTVTLVGSGTTIPAGGVTLNNVTLTMATNSGQIDSANDIMLNGGSTLTLVGNNTLNSLSFNNTGGTANPTVATASGLTLTATNAITAVNDNASQVPTISGTLLTLPDGANINTSTTAMVPTNLVISAPIAGGAVNKTGAGSLVLSGASTFNGPLNLNSGTLIFAANSTSTTASPAGSGTLAIAGGTAVMSDGTVRTIVNPITVGGDFTLGSLSGANGSAVAGNGVILSGNVDLGSGVNRTINVNSLLNTSTLSGVVSGTGSSITKTGPGTLALGVTTLSTVTTAASTTVTVPTTVGLTAGMPVAGTNIPAGATIASITNGTTLVLSVAATAAGTSNLQYQSLNGNTFDGGVNINGGTLQAGIPQALGTGTIKFGGGILQHALQNTTDYSAQISTANNQPIYIDTNGATVTYASPITSLGGGSLGKFGAGTLILTNTANYDGATLINAGTLQIGNGATVGALPASTTVLNGGLLMFNRSDAVSFFNPMTGAGIVGQAGTNTLTLNGTYAGFGGGVAVDQGIVKFTADANFPGQLLFGSSPAVPTTGTLDLSTMNGTFGGGLIAQTNAAGISTGIIGAGKTLTINGGLTVGYNLGTVAATATAATNLTLNGGGSLVVTGVTSQVNVGVSQTTQLNTATTDVLDVTALSNVNLGTVAAPISDVRIGFGQTDAGTVLLSNTANTIAATTLSVGHSNGSNGGVGILTLGTGTNVINADTINIGLSKINGTVAFASQAAGSPGTVTIGNKAGTGGADIIVGSQFGTGTGAVLIGTLDLRGHVATVVGNNVTVGLTNNNANTGTASGVISMDAGTFTASSLLLGSRINGAAAGTGTTANTATLNLGGGTFTVSGATTIANTAITATTGAANGTLNVTGGTFNTGTIVAAPKTAAGTGAATANINVSGGALNVTGATFTLGSQATAGTAVAKLNITGGVVTSNANILDGGGANTSTVVIDGGTLDLTGHTLGAATAIDSLTFASGGLRNVAQINNGTTGLTKTTAGTLVVGGNNAYTGPTNVTGGVLSSTGSIAASSAVTVSDPTATFEAAAAQRIKTLTVSAGGARVASAVKVALTVGDGTQAASTLSLTGGKLDLQTNGLAVDYAAGAANDTAALASVRGQVIAGFNGGAWTGTTGITSSTAAANSLAGVGYALAADVLPFANAATTDTFLGSTVDKSTVLARYTLSGDLNLDGLVDFLDLARLAQSYNVTDGTRQWSTGDVNYDGNTDFLDLAKMAQNYNTALPSAPVPGAPADFQADLAKAFAAVPEPGTISVLGIAAVALLARRRQNRRAA